MSTMDQTSPDVTQRECVSRFLMAEFQVTTDGRIGMTAEAWRVLRRCETESPY